MGLDRGREEGYWNERISPSPLSTSSYMVLHTDKRPMLMDIVSRNLECTLILARISTDFPMGYRTFFKFSDFTLIFNIKERGLNFHSMLTGTIISYPAKIESNHKGGDDVIFCPSMHFIKSLDQWGALNHSSTPVFVFTPSGGFIPRDGPCISPHIPEAAAGTYCSLLTLPIKTVSGWGVRTFPRRPGL